MPVLSACLGYPRIGIGRELKKALEGYWAGKISATELEEAASSIRRGRSTTRRWKRASTKST